MFKNNGISQGLFSAKRNRRRSKRNTAPNRGRNWLIGLFLLILTGVFWAGWAHIFKVFNQEAERVILSSRIPSGMARILSLAQLLSDVDSPLFESVGGEGNSKVTGVREDMRRAVRDVRVDLKALLEGDPNRKLDPLNQGTSEVLKTLRSSTFEPLGRLENFLIYSESFLDDVPAVELNQFHERDEVHPVLVQMQETFIEIYPIYSGVVSRFFQERLRSHFVGLRFIAIGLFLFPALSFGFLMFFFINPMARRINWEQKQVEALNMYSRAVLENTTNAIFFFNHRGIIQGVNHAGLRMFNMKEKHIKGDLLTSLFPKMQLSPGKFFSIQDLKSGKEASTVGSWRQSIAERGDGSQFHVNILVHEMDDPQTERKRYVAFVEDITEERQGEADLTKARQAAETAEKAKSDFLNMISHETLTPMIGIGEPVQALLETSLNSEQKEYVEMIQSSGNRLLKTINEMLDFSTMTTGKITFQDLEFNLDEAVRSTLDFSNPKPGVEMSSLIDQSVPVYLKGDPGRLRQALTHLVDNAVKFTEKGRILVRVSLDRETDSHAKLRFLVRDSGIGIAPEEKQKLFEAFYQVDRGMDRQFEGVGLGLAICKNIVDQMGGQIGVESELGKGSTFWFTALFEKQSTETAELTPDQNHLIFGARILLVSDSPADRYSIQNLIVKSGFSSSLAVKSSTAVDELCHEARLNHRYHVVIFDHSLSDIDILKLMRQVRSLSMLSFTRLVYMTRNQREIPSKKITQSHLDAILKGPLNEAKLIEFMKDLLPNFNPALPTLPPLKEKLLSRPGWEEEDTIESSQGESEDSLIDQQHQNFVDHETDAPTSDFRFSIPERPLKNQRVLLVEENILTRKITLGLVKSLGYESDSIADFSEVQQMLSEADYGYLITDFEFAGEAPIQLLAEVNLRYPALRCIALGEIPAELMDTIQAGDVQLHGRLEKPLQKEILESTLIQLAKSQFNQVSPTNR